MKPDGVVHRKNMLKSNTPSANADTPLEEGNLMDKIGKLHNRGDFCN
ncbi:hypothetical protein KKB18_03300 [bacterium]|nr:hypothetical protein [bacterium]